MPAGVAYDSIRPASRPLRSRLVEGLERPFAQILFGTIVPLLVLALLWDLASTLPWKAFYLSASSFGCAVSFGALVRRRHAPGVEAGLAGIRAGLAVLTLPWVLLVAAVGATTCLALLQAMVIDGWLAPDWWLALAVLPAFGLIAIPVLLSLMVFALGSRQAWRAAQGVALRRRRKLAALGLLSPLALGSAVELAFRGTEQIVLERYVDSGSGADSRSLAPWRPLARIHGWTMLEARCGYGEPWGTSVPTPAQNRARATLEALTGYEGYSSDLGD